MAYKIAELRAKTDDELIHDHDEKAQHFDDTPFEIRQELARRVAQAQGKLMVFLTGVITVLTLVNVYLVYVSL